MQLVDGNVKVLRTTRGVSETKTYGREEVVEEYGVTPEQIPDYKALIGDPSDNIPGVRGIGPKGAANLLQKFGTVAEIYENLDKISAKGTRKKLEEGRESAFMSLELARMRFDAPVEFDREALRFEGVSPGDPRRRPAPLRVSYPAAALRRAAGGRRRGTPARSRRSRSASPRSRVELSFEPVAAAPVGEGGRWCVAVSEERGRVTEVVPEGPLKVHDAKRLGARGAGLRHVPGRVTS